MFNSLTLTIESIGSVVVRRIESAGRLGTFLAQIVSRLWGHKFPLGETIKQLHFVGARTVPLILISGLFTGMVIALQFYDTLIRFGSVELLGAAVAMSLIRELGPVMAALMVIARVGSATCAEIGIMRNEQQFDALDCMAIDSYHYIMLPRLIAALIAVPLLTALFDVFGIGGGYIVGVLIHGVSEGAYLTGMADTIVWNDVLMGLIKSTLFGGVILWISLAKGFYLHIEQKNAGAEGVSQATTNAVVLSAVLMLFVDYIVSSLMI
ncbi:MAG: ABC transporter permease [Alteromonadaceae bacterium]|nr:ABC transporter permease [Alteromonadaceae bacterium]